MLCRHCRSHYRVAGWRGTGAAARRASTHSSSGLSGGDTSAGSSPAFGARGSRSSRGSDTPRGSLNGGAPVGASSAAASSVLGPRWGTCAAAGGAAAGPLSSLTQGRRPQGRALLQQLPVGGAPVAAAASSAAGGGRLSNLDSEPLGYCGRDLMEPGNGVGGGAGDLETPLLPRGAAGSGSDGDGAGGSGGGGGDGGGGDGGSEDSFDLRSQLPENARCAERSNGVHEPDVVLLDNDLKQRVQFSIV